MAHQPAPTPESRNLRESITKLRRLFNRRDKIGFGVLLGGMLVAAGLEVVSIGTVPVFITLAMDPEPILEYEWAAATLAFLGITTSRELVVAGCLAMLAIFAFKTLYSIGLTYAKVRYTQNRKVRLTDRLFKAYMHAPYEFHLNRNSSELLRNIQAEVNAVVNGVLKPMLSLIMKTLMTAAIVVMLIAVEPLMALLALGLVGLGGFGYQFAFQHWIRAYGKVAQEERKVSLKIARQGLGGLKEARVLRREHSFTQQLRASLERAMRAARFSNVVNGSTGPFLEFVAVGGLLTITIVMVLTGRELASIAPTLGLFGVALMRLRGNVAGIVGGVTNLRYKAVSVDPVYHDLDRLRHAHDQARAPRDDDAPPLTFHHELRVENLWYRYPGADEPALRNVNLTIPRGHAVGFIGPTGAGKTTVVDVILGLLEPEHGQVTVDGVDIHQHLAAWHRSIGYIPQFIYLTDDTIRRNIALGVDDKKIDDARVQHALDAAQLTDFIAGLPQGLDTVVGERGVRISGGQRQRLGIARALYHDPALVVMDEATSALDDATERGVMDAINALKGERTVIMIAHRLSTVRECDTLYRIAHGEVETAGTYDEVVHGDTPRNPLAARV